MPRKNPVSDRELQICARLRQFRQHTKLSQVAFAKEVGLDTGRLSSYEHGRARLPFVYAHSICLRFNLSQRWLAEGKGPMSFALPIRPDLLDQISTKALFSRAYFEILKPYFDREFEILDQVLGDAPSAAELADYKQAVTPWAGGSFSPDDFFWVAARRISQAGLGLPADLLQDLMHHIGKAVREFEKKHGGVLDSFRAAALRTRPSPKLLNNEDRIESQIYLTNKSDEITSVGMPTWVQLKSDVRRLTKERGAKAALARHCGVTRQAVATWLDEDSTTEPGAEATLKLLDWAAVEKAKLKSPSDARTPEEQAARTGRKHSHGSKQPEPKTGSQKPR